MEFNISTPALLFSAITLSMLAYTNRFLAIANLVRQLVAVYRESGDENVRRQLSNFRLRLKLIKYTQVFAVLSFMLCVACMLLIFVSRIVAAEVLFALSLVSMIVSLALSLYEVFISIGALKLELDLIDGKGNGPRDR